MNIYWSALIIFSFLFAPSGFSQSPSDLLPNEGINTLFLEHLIKLQVDSVRQAHHCSTLVNDSILYVASKHHSDYMKTNGVLSHKEKNKHYENPPQRIFAYGGKEYHSGENILFTFFNRSIKAKKKTKKTVVLKTYGQLAKSMVQNWVDSPGHFKNIINCKYSLTGVSVSIDYKKKKVYATQKFAWKMNAFNFPNHKQLFPFDDYQPAPQVSSFNNIPNTLGTHEHLWELEHDTDSTACKSCDSLLNEPPRMGMRLINNRFKLKIENSDFVKNLIHHKYDGFAIEIVEFKDYICDNPAYYTKPSRRNGQCVLNGQPMQPVYRKAIYKGFKNRKRIEDFKFIPYLFKQQSIPFLHRFKRFNVDKYSSKYFEIDLGELPKLESSIWGYNLLVIKDHKICKTYAFQTICGELYQEKFPLEFIPSDTLNAHYTFTPLHLEYAERIPFKAQETEVNPNIFNHFINHERNEDYELDSLLIFCYASIEGDSTKNIKLQKTRAKNIQHILDKHQLKGNVNLQITATNWKHFNDYIEESKCWSFLTLLDRKTRIDYINNDYKKDLQPILNAGRASYVRFVEKIPFNDEHLLYYIQHENRSLIDSIYTYADNQKKRFPFNKSLNELYRYLHKLVVKGQFKPDVLAEFILPQINLLLQQTKEHRVLYAYQFPKAFGLEQSIQAQKVWTDHIDDVHKHQTSPLYTYQKYREDVNNIISGKMACNFRSAQELISNLDYFYASQVSGVEHTKVPFMVANINYHLLNHVFSEKPAGNMVNAMQALNQLQNFYESHNTYTKDKALYLAKMAQYYHLETSIQSFLKPHIHLPEVQAYLILLNYQTYDTEGQFYKDLIQAADVFPKDDWCSMFMRSCRIPFQVFNNETVRHLYCEKCEEELEQVLDDSLFGK